MTDYHFKDTRTLTIWVGVFAWTAITLMLVNLCIDLYMADLIRGIIAHDAVRSARFQAYASDLDALQKLLNKALVPLWVLNLVLFFVWLYRSACNTRALGARGLKYSPGWTVGYFFIPIINIVRGYSCMREVWQSSHAPHDWSKAKNPPLLLTWWIAYLVLAVLNRVDLAMLKSAGNDLHALLRAIHVEIASIVLFIIIAAMFIRIIQRISAVQREHQLNPVPSMDALTAPEAQPG